MNINEIGVMKCYKITNQGIKIKHDTILATNNIFKPIQKNKTTWRERQRQRRRQRDRDRDKDKRGETIYLTSLLIYAMGFFHDN